MVEFISEGTEEKKVEEPPPEEAPQVRVVQESLELLVEAHTEELHESVNQDYIDESNSLQGDYYQPADIQLADAPDWKHQIRPLVYDENDIPVVVDIFELYGKKGPADDKWWMKRSL